MESGELFDRHVEQGKFLERPQTRALLSGLILCACLWPAGAILGSDSRFPVSDPPRNDIRLDNRVPVSMRDGTILYADVYRPLAEGRYPVLVARTPYSAEARPEPKFFSRRGYVFVIQDVRGRYESEGRWDPFRHEARDGYDTIEWAARQPWSNGKVGMLGKSYLGLVQWQAAKEAPPHLVTIFPDVASTSPYHDFVTLNGGWRLSFNFGWGAVRQESRIGQNPRLHWSDSGSDNLAYDRVIWHLPLLDMQRLLGRRAQFYEQWIEHPDYDDYWKSLSAVEKFEKITIPVHNFGGWFDIFTQGTVDGYVGMRERGGSEVARQQSRMIVGPWGHGPSRTTGDLDFGPEAPVDVMAVQLRWFDYWLQGRNGLDQETPVKIFVMGRNRWRFEKEYPLPGTRYRKLYLGSDGGANSSRGDGRLGWNTPPADSPADRYLYDPDNPVPSLGGNNCCGTPTPAGPVDQRPIEQRRDVLVYTSDILQEEVEVTGPVKLVLYAASDAPDTDFVAKLVDVYPDGRAINIAEGILRARYRDGPDRPQPLQKDRVYTLTIDMVDTSNAFLPGHRIRLDVTSSHFPQFDRNPNTGEAFGTGASTRPAQQTINHSAEYPSHLLLPVIPAE